MPSSVPKQDMYVKRNILIKNFTFSNKTPERFFCTNVFILNATNDVLTGESALASY